MELLGTIEPNNGATVSKSEWIALIAVHPSLAQSAPRQGINPFTKEPVMYKPAPDSARVMADGAAVGAMHWAMDDSRRLVVWSLPTTREHVMGIARDVASDLGWRFLPNADA
jgi:hypothetical protein